MADSLRFTESGGSSNVNDPSQNVTTFRYLKHYFSGERQAREDTSERVSTEWSKWLKFSEVLYDIDFPMTETKIGLAIIRLTAMYASEMPAYNQKRFNTYVDGRSRSAKEVNIAQRYEPHITVTKKAQVHAYRYRNPEHEARNPGIWCLGMRLFKSNDTNRLVMRLQQSKKCHAENGLSVLRVSHALSEIWHGTKRRNMPCNSSSSRAHSLSGQNKTNFEYLEK